MDARHRFLAQAASDAFGLQNPNAVESAMSEHLPLVDSFWQETGPPVLFITHQPALEENEAGQMNPVGSPKLTVSKEYPYLIGKLVFFFRNGTVKGSVDVKTIDNDVSCGEVNGTGLDCLQSTIQELFCPVLSQMNSRMWGHLGKSTAKMTHVDTLVTLMKKFGASVEKASLSLRSGVKLQLADKDIATRVEVHDAPGTVANMDMEIGRASCRERV